MQHSSQFNSARICLQDVEEAACLLQMLLGRPLSVLNNNKKKKLGDGGNGGGRGIVDVQYTLRHLVLNTGCSILAGLQLDAQHPTCIWSAVLPTVFSCTCQLARSHLGGFIGHLDPILQNVDRELGGGIGGDPQSKVGRSSCWVYLLAHLV